MREGLCPGPHVHAYQVEEAIERHYAHVRFRPVFIADVGAHIDSVINEQEAAAHLLHEQISGRLKELDTKEENLIDLAADGTLPQTKVKAKLRDIATERRRLTERLDTASADLTDSAQLIQAALKLLEAPRSSTDGATSSNDAYSTRRSSRASTSKTARSPIMTCVSLLASFTPCNVNTCHAPKRSGQSATAGGQQKGHPPSRWPFNFRRCPSSEGRSRGQGFY
jgi:hypothetical protein